MSWEIRLTPWSIVISVFSPMWNLLHSERSWPSPFSFSFLAHIRCTVTCGLAHAWYKQFKHASVPKASAWEVESPKYVCYPFSKSFWGETHAKRCLEALSGAIVRCFLNFMKNMLWESTSRLPPNRREASARAEDAIITVSTRLWHRRNVRIDYFWKQECIMKSLKHL